MPAEPRACRVPPSSAISAVDCPKSSHPAPRAHRRRLAHVLHADAHRAQETLARQRLGLDRLPAQDQEAITDSTALTTNTQAVPAPAITRGEHGSAIREAFIANPFSASAAGSCTRGTSPDDRRVDGPAHREPDAVGEHQQQQRGIDRVGDDREAQQQRRGGHPELRDDK